VRRRLFAPFALALTLVMGVSACTLSANIATTKVYDPSDGVGADVGDLALRNIMLIINDSGTANLVMTVVNRGGEDVVLRVQYKDGATETNDTISLPGFPALTRIGDDPGEGLLLRGTDVVAGGLTPVYFQYADIPGVLVLIPVLDGALGEYELLVP
jgi:hypothetical protein